MFVIYTLLYVRHLLRCNVFQMYNSLRQIRNSATKKQLSKIFDYGKSRELDQQESVAASTPDEQETGFTTPGKQLVFSMFPCTLVIM